MIKVIESINKSSINGVEASKNYATSSYKYAKLKALHMLSLTATSLSKMMIIGSFVFIGLIFLSVSSAIAIGNYLENSSLGYLIVGLTFFVFGILVFFIRKQIEKRIIKKISKQIFN